MTYARTLVYSIVQDHAAGEPIEPGSIDDDRMHEALNQVEDDRLHAEAVKLYERGTEVAKASATDVIAAATGSTMMAVAMQLDPYEERGGHLVRKSDGKPVAL